MKQILLQGEIPVNCYIIEDKGSCFIVDPGYEKEKLIDFVTQTGNTVIGILITHGHIDHIGALDAYKVPIYIHSDELSILNNNYLNGFSYFNKTIPYDLNLLEIHEVNDGDCITINDKTIKVIHTPGHTKGSVCYQYDNELYSGDTLFESGVGRWDFPTGNQKALAETIVKLVNDASDELIIHPAHGNSTNVGKERENNSYYRHWSTGQLISPNINDNEPLFLIGKDALEKEDYQVAYNHFLKLSNMSINNPLTDMYLKYAKSNL